MQNIYRNLTNIFSDISTWLFIFGLVAVIYLTLKGVFPVLYRLGKGLATSKIAIFAKGDNLTSLQLLLKNTGLLSEKNFIPITKIEDFKNAKKASVYLVFWPDWNNMDAITNIINGKKNGTPLIVYAPPQNNLIQDQRTIPKEIMAKLNEDGNTIVNNLRGRLLNDLIVSLITASYEK